MKETSMRENETARTTHYNYQERCADITLGLLIRNTGVASAGNTTLIKR